MEFSFFLVILTILMIGLNHIGMVTFDLLFKKKEFRYILLAFALVAIWFFRPLGICFLMLGGLAVLVQDVPYFRKRSGLLSGIVFSLILIPAAFYYQQAVDRYWLSGNDSIISVLSKWNLFRNYRFVEIYSVASFFWWAYPAMLCGLVTLLWSYTSTKSRKTFWYRFCLSFDHRLAAIVIVLWSGFVLFGRLSPAWYNPGLRLVLMSLGIYWSLYYVFYGFLIIMYGMKRNRIPYIAGWIALYSVLILSGPVFLVPIVFLMGVGMSDIWMRYSRKHLANRVTK